MAAQVGALRVSLGIDSAAFTNGLSDVQRQLKATGERMQKVGAGMATVGAGMSVAITAPSIALGAHLLQGSQDAAHAAGQVQAALTSMGDASGKTMEQLTATAESLRNLSGVDDDEILTKLTANMLSFGNIAGDAFDRAQLAALNLSARMGSDLQGATMLIGKALNDPLKGLAALGRAGIQFTDVQKAQIKAMVGVGDAAGAQAIMLSELERQFGGAAKAAADADVTTPLRTALMDLEGAFEPIIRDVIAPLIAKVAEMTKAFASLSPETQKFIAVGATLAAVLGPVLVGIGSVVSAVGVILPALAGIGPVLAAVGAAFAAISSFAIPALVAGLGLLFSPIGLVVAAVAGLTAVWLIWGDDIKRIVGQAVEHVSGRLTEWGQSVAHVFGAAVDLITGAVNVVTQIFRALGSLLRGDFSTMWNALGSAVAALVHGVLQAFRSLFPDVMASLSALASGVRRHLMEGLRAVFDWVINRVHAVSEAFRMLWDKVVGHSYIPDMVDAIGQHMSRLQGLMVDPAVSMTDEVGGAFAGLESQINSIFKSIGSKDWKGVLGGIFDIGGQIGGGKFSKWADLGKSIMGAFGGSLPGFKEGGTFNVGGAGMLA